MEEAEKMAALKKVYADIILNTAKEAAQRIMVSEHKALSFQQQLSATKEEALNMFLRLKNMMDSKVAEVEITSLSQRKRIEELEAQLNEAEDMVTDLRGELKVAQDELEKVKNNQGHSLDDQIVKVSAVSHEDTSHAEKLHTSEHILLPPLDSGPTSISTSKMKETLSIQRNVDNCCFMSENATTHTEPLGNVPEEKYYAGNPDIASIIMRSKEPELYRNGCTQRIRAFERNLLDDKLPLPNQTDDQCSNIKNESTMRENETAKVTCPLSPMDGDMGSVEKKATGLEELLQVDSSCDKGQAVKFSRSVRKRRGRYRNVKLTSCTNKVLKACEGEDPSRIIDEELEKNSDFQLASVSLNTTDGNGIGTDTEVIKAASVENAANEDTALVDKSELTRHDSEVADSFGVLDCKLNLESTKSDSKDEKAGGMTNEVLSQAVNDRVLKYTFRRKRKKESLSCAEEDTSLGNKNIAKKSSGENKTSVPEPQKSSLIMESSRDSRRLVQVARQLISLSEKRWWQ